MMASQKRRNPLVIHLMILTLILQMMVMVAVVLSEVVGKIFPDELPLLRLQHKSKMIT